MKYTPRGFGGRRPDPERIKREGWRNDGVLVISPADPRLSWPEQEMLRQLGDKLYGPRPAAEAEHG